jgi:hypothetical protein
VPDGLKGEFTAVLEYNTDPFPVTLKETKFTVK